MHEISLLENVLEILLEYAESQDFTQVKKVCLEVGQLSSIETDALRFGFDVVMKNTLAENAELEIIIAEGLGICQQCKKMVNIQALHDPCPLCGHADVKVAQGMDMKIKDLIVI